MQPWISRCGYYQLYGPYTLEKSGSAPARTFVPYPEPVLQETQKTKIFTAADSRSAWAYKKEDDMPSAQTLQGMKISGKTTVSPILTGMFPLILIAGIIILVILKK